MENKVQLKEMEYKNIRETSILGSGVHNGYEWVILSLGSHPCAYIRVPDTHRLYKYEFDKWDSEIIIDVHGGVTFCRMGEGDREYAPHSEGWWIGWDYTHLGDFDGRYVAEDGTYMSDCSDKKHTTKEIFYDVKYAIEQLIELDTDVMK